MWSHAQFSDATFVPPKGYLISLFVKNTSSSGFNMVEGEVTRQAGMYQQYVETWMT